MHRPKYPPDSAVLVISPHLDDGVFGCGDLLAAHPGSVVVTALAGPPPSYERMTDWDSAAGFKPGDDVMAARRAEDAAALGILDARPIWLDFRDDQYGDSPEINELADALKRQICDIGTREIFIPMGLFHNDHKRVHAAALLVFYRHPEFRWYAYEEPNYRLVPRLRDERLASLADAGICARDHTSPVNEASEVKRRAVHAYRSQLRALATPGRPGLDDVFAPERYWRLQQRSITATDQHAE